MVGVLSVFQLFESQIYRCPLYVAEVVIPSLKQKVKSNYEHFSAAQDGTFIQYYGFEQLFPPFLFGLITEVPKFLTSIMFVNHTPEF